MSDEKKHIQHGTVQETLLIPLYARKKCVEKYPDLFHDEDAVRLFDRIDYVMENEPQEFSNLAGGIRQYNFVCEINEYLKEHPRACIVNLGCGLDTTFYQVDNGQTKGYNVDFPDVIAIRNELLPPKERETNIVGDLTDKSWYEKIDFKEEDGAVFIAGGVFCYLTYDNVKAQSGQPLPRRNDCVRRCLALWSAVGEEGGSRDCPDAGSGRLLCREASRERTQEVVRFVRQRRSEEVLPGLHEARQAVGRSHSLCLPH